MNGVVSFALRRPHTDCGFVILGAFENVVGDEEQRGKRIAWGLSSSKHIQIEHRYIYHGRRLLTEFKFNEEAHCHISQWRGIYN